MSAKFIVDYDSLKNIFHNVDFQEKYYQSYKVFESHNKDFIKQANKILRDLGSLQTVLAIKTKTKTYALASKLDFTYLGLFFNTFQGFKTKENFLSYLAKFEEALIAYMKDFDHIPARSGSLNDLRTTSILLKNLQGLIQELKSSSNLPFYGSLKEDLIQGLKHQADVEKDTLKNVSLMVFKAFKRLEPIWKGSDVVVGNNLSSCYVTVGIYSFSILGDSSDFVIGDQYEYDPRSGDDGRSFEDYKNLLNEIESPGSVVRQQNKPITLYTARPTKDRDFYLRNKKVPSGIFLTDSLTHAEGIAHDMDGGRDLWAVKIYKKYLYQTLESPVAYYQVVSEDKFVPVVSMELLE